MNKDISKENLCGNCINFRSLCAVNNENARPCKNHFIKVGEIESLKSEVKRLKDKYEPEPFSISEHDLHLNVFERKTCKTYYTIHKVQPDAKERAEALCRELNEKARVE